MTIDYLDDGHVVAPVELPKLMETGGFIVNNANFIVDPEGDDGLTRVSFIWQLLDVLQRVKGDSNKEIWFRGQRLRSRKLEPTLFRNTERRFTAPLTTEYGADAIRQPEHDLGDLHQLLKIIQPVFARHGFQNLTNMEYLLLAQHYGVATPLLDWSTDPLIAAWFALENKTKLTSEDPPTLWLLDPQFANTAVPFHINTHLSTGPGVDVIHAQAALFKSRDTLRENATTKDFPLALYSGNNFSSRIGGQSGKFTFSGPNVRYRGVLTGSVTLGENLERHFAPILLDPEHAESMLQELASRGINEMTVYGSRALDDAVAEELDRAQLTSDGRPRNPYVSGWSGTTVTEQVSSIA